MRPLLTRPKAALGGSSSPSPRAKGEGGYNTSSPATRLLDQHARDMVRLALQGRYDPVTGREEEIDRVVQILLRRQKNNPVLLGEPGVGGRGPGPAHGPGPGP